MSKKRLIPKLLLKSSFRNPNKTVLVISKKFSDYIEIGDVVSQAKIYQDQGADELYIVDIDKNHKGIKNLCEIIKKVSEEIFMPITVGGGVQNEKDFKQLLNNGADKISINTIAVENPSVIKEASEKYGSQCVVVSIDYALNKDGEYRVYTKGGTSETPWHPVDWALQCEALGAGEILLTSINHDGMKNGINIEITQKIARQLQIPIIASGGCGEAAHFIDAYLLGGADAVSAGSFFAHKDQNFMQTRSQIYNSGINIRIYR